MKEDSSLSSFFENVDMTGLIAHQTNFIGKALGGPKVYEGRDLAVAHVDLHIVILRIKPDIHFLS
jgi:hemoglobin